MHFWVYHKSAKQFLGPFNENTIVDFCISNKESASSFYICVNGKQNQMEWSAFAAKYAYLFENKATERELRETANELSEDEDFTTPKSPFIKILIIVIPLLVLIGVAAFVLLDAGASEKELPVKESKSAEVIKKAEPVQKKEEKIYPDKRSVLPSDENFSEAAASKKELYAAWKAKKPLSKELSPQDIKTVMDSFIPSLTECYNSRTAAGDKNLNGTINMKIKILGTGVVSGVIFTDDKYKSTIFGDCVSDALKKHAFPTFKAKEQIFTYYYNF